MTTANQPYLHHNPAVGGNQADTPRQRKRWLAYVNSDCFNSQFAMFTFLNAHHRPDKPSRPRISLCVLREGIMNYFNDEKLLVWIDHYSA
jgi:hypothetical protein